MRQKKIPEVAPDATSFVRGAGPSGGGRRRGILRGRRGRIPAAGPQAAPHRLAQYEFNLAVDAAQLVGRPALDLPPEEGVGPQEECLAIVGHP
jgi:hypothetical protein